MAGSVGKTDDLNNEPNVVPMIDVLLVLLIIFMIIVPISRKALDLQLPDPTPSDAQGPPPSQIVLEVMPGNQYAINKEPVSREALPGRLKEIYDPRPDKIIFVKGDPRLKYEEVIWAMDVARGSGVRVIGVPPKETEQ
jgi:biopolymer transport protein TolR